MSLERQLGRMLWDIARAEGVAVSAARILTQHPCMTAPDRFRLETIFRQEQEHATLFRGFASAWLPTRPHDAFYATLDRDAMVMGSLRGDARFAMTLATMLWNEENTLRAYPRWIALFSRYDKNLERVFQHVLEEEREHVQFGSGLVARIERDWPKVFQVFSRFYEATRRVYPVLIHRSMIPCQRALTEAVSQDTPAI